MTTNDHHDLDASLGALRSALAGLDTPHCVEKELMQAFAATTASRPWYRRLNLPEWLAAGAGSFAAVAMLGLLLLPPRLAGDPDGAQPLLRFDDGAAFVALDGFDGLDHIGRGTEPRLVEAEVPRTMLAALGVPVTPENAGEAVLAEILVGTGGEPLALRLSSID